MQSISYGMPYRFSCQVCFPWALEFCSPCGSFFEVLSNCTIASLSHYSIVLFHFLSKPPADGMGSLSSINLKKIYSFDEQNSECLFARCVCTRSSSSTGHFRLYTHIFGCLRGVHFVHFLAMLIFSIGTVFVVCFSFPLFTFLLLPLGLFYRRIMIYYLATSREL